MKQFYLAKERLRVRTFLIGGTLTSDKNLIADSFNKYFTSSVTLPLESFRTSCGSGTSPTQSAPSRHYPDFKFAEVSEAYVRSQPRGLKRLKRLALTKFQLAFWLIPRTLWPNP